MDRITAAVSHRVTYRLNEHGSSTIWLGEEMETAQPFAADQVTECCGRLLEELPHQDRITSENDIQVSCPRPMREV